MSETVLFDAQFQVKAIDPDGKKFDRVSRIVASSTTLEMDLSLDVATDIYPISPSQSFSFQLVSTLHPAGSGNANGTDGAGAASKEVWRQGAGGIAEDWDYVMYGKIYKYDEGASSDSVTVYGSFGGLLMALTGSYRHFSNVTVGSNVYLLVR
ncbi:RNA polymerase [Microstroma glucosiphilum]|uniref:DNA-directed RNA polymerases I, II, and III subunit RPABC3 n=1 Tax=Pseudomicrostroma glucosiphilum TaxID=1684307 RepID=A0A316U9R1_9BASI|nr:RNA polymerase [Pseudomicrostroma glucosiphilum]PWN21970.1 RNA polymerase [Pseudomicrostroma glucosiphilum]